MSGKPKENAGSDWSLLSVTIQRELEATQARITALVAAADPEQLITLMDEWEYANNGDVTTFLFGPLVRAIGHREVKKRKKSAA